MIVSLEAIFLSTFVMISQNRADAKRQVVADLQWQTVQEEDKQNVQLLELSNQILELTRAVHDFTARFSEAPGSRFVLPGPGKRRLAATARHPVAVGAISAPERSDLA